MEKKSKIRLNKEFLKKLSNTIKTQILKILMSFDAAQKAELFLRRGEPMTKS